MGRRNYQQVLQIASSQQDAVEPRSGGRGDGAAPAAKLERKLSCRTSSAAPAAPSAAGSIDQARQYYEKRGRSTRTTPT